MWICFFLLVCWIVPGFVLCPCGVIEDCVLDYPSVECLNFT